MSRTPGPHEDLQQREHNPPLASDDLEAAGYRMTASSAATGSTTGLAAVGLIKYLVVRPARRLWGLLRRRR